ncbi:putative cytoskeleton-associated protein [Erysiphe neolycopersici]|uniref:Putative cytoskeleton-associated protein n=1 Tax=Erysiphe neolycopersici TaxID=212602 RepID=A0A420I2G6_9PEZI|nr:putative cytoskeleton-associated protein [Erysiphe neolycopersici]
MAVLSPNNHDAIVVGLGILVTCAVFVTMRQMLIYSRDSAIIPPSENKPQYITQDVEDSLKLSTLEKLLDSPSWVIRDTTSTIICERALHNETTFTTILRCISGADYDTREKGIRALNLILDSSTIEFLHTPQGYVALIKCLEYCVTDYKHNPFDADWDNWCFRDIVEQLALFLVLRLVEKYGPSRLLQYRFIEQWLVKEPWGNTTAERQSNFATFLQETSQKLNEIVTPFSQDANGMKQLQKAKLIADNVTGPDTFKSAHQRREGGEDYSDFYVSDSGRRRVQSSTNEYVRRRHREAMVLNDGSRPVGREDIIQRER